MQVFNIDVFEQVNDFNISVNVYDLDWWEDPLAQRPYKVKPHRLTKIKVTSTCCCTLRVITCTTRPSTTSAG